MQGDDESLLGGESKKKKTVVRGDEKIIKHMRLFGALMVANLVILNIVFVVFLVKMAHAGNMTGKMYDLSFSMNASTSRTMGKLWSLTEHIQPEHTRTLVSNLLQISDDVAFLTGSLVEGGGGNFSHVVANARQFAQSINTTALATALSNAAGISSTLTGSAQRVSEVVDLLDPDEIDRMLQDVRNVTGELRRVVGSHNIRLNF